MVENVTADTLPAAVLASLPRWPACVSWMDLKYDFPGARQQPLFEQLRRRYPGIRIVRHYRDRHLMLAIDARDWAVACEISRRYMSQVCDS